MGRNISIVGMVILLMSLCSCSSSIPQNASEAVSDVENNGVENVIIPDSWISTSPPEPDSDEWSQANHSLKDIVVL